MIKLYLKWHVDPFIQLHLQIEEGYLVQAMVKNTPWGMVNRALYVNLHR